MRFPFSSSVRRAAVILLVTSLPLACGDDPAGPTLDPSLVVGSWTLQTLAFDPQGSLSETDILARIGNVPELNLSTGGTAQVVYRDPVNNLVRTIEGTFRTTAVGVRIDFANEDAAGSLLLPRRVDLDYDGTAGTLRFEGTPSQGVSRNRLRVFVPEWQDEQLLDPVPGELTVVFGR